MAERKGLSEAVPTDALKEAGQQLLGLLVQRAAQAAAERVEGLSDRLAGVADNGGNGLMTALRGERSDDGDEAAGDGGGLGSAIGSALGSAKDKVTDALGIGGGGGGSGGGKKLKVTVISESLDVGLPLRTTYNLWTQYEDFPGFMKKVDNIDRDDEKTHWKAQVFWSHREWDATTVEQVPDSHIVWTSTGAKGHVDGAVTFTELGRNLTRVLLVLEYHPQGLFERTGNLWRAQGRRARLEFQHFRRHAMTNALLHPDDIEGWRGEIRDGEIVKTHDEALEEEQRSDEEQRDTEQEPERDEAAEPSDEDEDYAADEDEDEAAYGEDEARDEDTDEDEDRDDEDRDDDEGDARRREPVGARGDRGR